MPIFCLPADKAAEFKKNLKDKTMNLGDLMKMTTEARTKVFEKYAGDSAKEINKLFESKLVLKNKLQGLKNWAAKVGQFGRYGGETKTAFESKMLEYKAAQRERILSPKENETFLNDLADIKLGTHISKEEAGKVFEFSKIVEDNLSKFDSKTEEWKSKEDAAKYGASKLVYENFVNDLKIGDQSIKSQLKQYGQTIANEWESNKAMAVLKAVGGVINTITTNSIALVATLDDSFLGRQGLKTLYTEPKRFVESKIKGIPYKNVWWDGAKNSFIDGIKELGGINAEDALSADVYSKPNFINGDYQKSGVLPKTEEQYPTSLPERIPYLGRVFKASEIMFKGSAIRMRTGLYDFTKQLAKNNNVKWTDSQIKDVGHMVNAITARGSLGPLEGNKAVRIVMWAPKLLMGDVETLTAGYGGAQFKNGFARKQAAINLLSIIGSVATVLLIAQAIKKDSVEWDPRSADFGKIVVGNTRFNVTGGSAAIITLAARMLFNSTKSTTTDKISMYSPDFGKTSRWDALINFMTNKVPPSTGVVVDMLKGQDWNGNKPTFVGEAARLFTPIGVGNAIQNSDNLSADVIAGIILDGFGINASTYKTETPQDKLKKKIQANQDKIKEIQKQNNPSVIDKILKSMGIK